MIKEELIMKLGNKENTETSIIEAETIPEMVKNLRGTKYKNPYYGKVKKHEKYLCLTTYNYVDEVNKQRVAEGKIPNFKTQILTRGVRINDVPIIIEHKGKIYLQVIIIKEIEHEYKCGGEIISDNQINPYLRFESLNKSQGLDHPIEIKVFEIGNIVSIV